MKKDAQEESLQPFGVQFLEVPDAELENVDGGFCRKPRGLGTASKKVSGPLAIHGNCPDWD
jgi:hypothetical protein